MTETSLPKEVSVLYLSRLLKIHKVSCGKSAFQAIKVL